MTEWDFDQRLRELERKALFKKMTRDVLKKSIPPFLLIVGSIGFLIELDGAGQKVAAGFFLAGSYCWMLVGLWE